jgi:hypothetical protein
MKSLWFKATFVKPILSGQKTDTIRRASNRLPAVGDQIALSVGPREPFATAEVLSVEPAVMSASKREKVAKLYGDDLDNMVTIRFRLVQ